MDKQKLLIVDDDERFLALTIECLSEETEFLIDTARTGEQALEKIHQSIPSVILLDIKLPQMDGFEVCRRIRQIDIASGLPILMMTGIKDFEAIDKSYHAGATDFIDKPNDWPWFTLLYKLRYLVRSTVTSHQSLKQAAELANKENSRLLRELQFQKYALDEHAIVSIADGQGNISYVNDKFCEISGYQREELLGKNHRVLKSSEHSAGMYRQLWERITRGETWHGEIKNFNKAGELYWIKASVVPFMDENEHLFQYISICTDISQQKELEYQLQQALQQAETANQIKTEFLAMMSHETRTPLHGIMGMMQLFADTPLSFEQREYLTIIEESSESLLNIVNDILQFSEISAGNFKLQSQLFNLTTCAEEALNLIRSQAEEKSLQVYFQHHLSVKMVIGDPDCVRQVLFNLLDNAVKFTYQGSVSLKLERVEQTQQSLSVKITVEDTGIGISAEAQEKLFSLFTQADSSTTREFSGIGLGLCISKGLVELMGGEIVIVSEEGKGSQFSFEVQFPIEEELDLKYSQSIIPMQRNVQKLSNQHAEVINASDVPHLDKTILLEFKQALGENFLELKQCYLEDATRLLAGLDRQCRQKNLIEVNRIAHSIKSSSANMGALKLSELAAKLEEQTQSQQQLPDKQQKTALLTEFSRVQNLLEEF